MHPILFATKRVHLRAVAVTRALIKPYGLTPARFDMMRVVFLQPDGIAQSTLRWLLGLSPPTVSRMLKSLEGLGLVDRSEDPNDARILIVRLTPRGVLGVRMCLEATVVNDEAERTAARGVLGDSSFESDGPEETRATIESARDRVKELGGLLTAMRKAYEDTAPFAHPWRTGDFLPLILTTLVDGRCRYGSEDPFAAFQT